MKTISQGKIFLSDERGVIENKEIKRYCSFNYDNFYSPAKQPIGNLYTLHDDMLAPNAAFSFYTSEKGYLVVIPITGTLNYFDEKENETDIEVGEALTVFVDKNSFVKLKNPYDDAIISYLVIGIKSEQDEPSSPSFHNIDLSKYNQLNTITPVSTPFNISIGRFKGRGESQYRLNNPAAILYAFVLAGAFEIEGRLLHDRDGIALWDTNEAEIEALSNDATMLCIELLL